MGADYARHTTASPPGFKMLSTPLFSFWNLLTFKNEWDSLNVIYFESKIKPPLLANFKQNVRDLERHSRTASYWRIWKNGYFQIV
jgi:hypothetical protein